MGVWVIGSTRAWFAVVGRCGKGGVGWVGEVAAASQEGLVRGGGRAREGVFG